MAQQVAALKTHVTVGEKTTPKAMVTGNHPAQSQAKKKCADVMAAAPPSSEEVSQHQH